jgi:hypothetical protein
VIEIMTPHLSIWFHSFANEILSIET